MSRIKICGLSRSEDIIYVNETKPDYAGFIINFPRSHRNIDVQKLKELKQTLNPDIKAVGVFVDQPVELVAGIAQAGLIELIQLHGKEDENYIRRLRIHTGVRIIKAFQITSPEDMKAVEKSSADYVLLDAGQGSGKTFDWQFLADVERPYFLAGGISADNIEAAMNIAKPFALDVSSGVETDKIKDKKKMMEVVRIAHKEEKYYE